MSLTKIIATSLMRINIIQYTALITSLFKAVQDIRTIFDENYGTKLYPVIFLRDDIYEIVQDADKNKWGDFRVDLNWDYEKLSSLLLLGFPVLWITECKNILHFSEAWARMFGTQHIGIGSRSKRKISTFDFIARSTLLRPRDFVAICKIAQNMLYKIIQK
ncbi:MAG: hypothetical protein R3F36_02830 [Candidatus Competibacteraceae bacterium]